MVNGTLGTTAPTQQQGSTVIGLPATFSEALTKGKALPDNLQKYFYGFDFEIQLANLDFLVIDYLNTAFEQVCILALKVLNIGKDKYSDKDKSFYLDWIDTINSEVKVIIRGYRGINGFWVREAGMIRSKGETVMEQRGAERRSFLNRLIGGGTRP